MEINNIAADVRKRGENEVWLAGFSAYFFFQKKEQDRSVLGLAGMELAFLTTAHTYSAMLCIWG